MNKEELIELKEKLSKLSEEEKKKRDLYLRDLSLGKISGPQTGYPSIDKPWLKYYTEDDINSVVPKMGINEYMDLVTKDYDEKIAFEYYGKEITYKEFKENRDKAVKALINMGVKKGDIVSVCLPNIPEVAYVFYALMKIGAVANMLDPRTNKSTLEENVNDAGSKLMITLDSVTNKFVDTNVDKIVTVSPLNTLPKAIQFLAKAKDKSLRVELPKDNRIISYDKFINTGKNIKEYKLDKVDGSSPAVIAYTGGSTGIPKGVVVSHDAVNTMVVENSMAGYDIGENDKCINIAPPWTYYGLSNCLNAFLCMGIKDILIPALGPDDLGKLIYKHKPNHVITVPSALRAVMNDDNLKKENLSYLKTIIVGADKLDTKFESEFNEFLSNNGANIRVNKGYGMTEVCAAATYTKSVTNTKGTVGIPYVFENISIFDVDDKITELPVGEKGEIAISGPKNMLSYFGENKKSNNNVLITHSDGTVWVHTGDVGHFDIDGKLYIDDRIKRMFVRNGFKVFPSEVETQILKEKEINQAAVIGVPDESTGLRTKAFLVLSDNGHVDIENLKEQLKTRLYDYEIPDSFEIVKRLPLTGMNKIDYKTLTEKEKVKTLKK